MGHPAIDNRTPYAFEAAFAAGEDGRPLLVPIVQATYSLDADGGLALAEKQLPVKLAGEPYGEPGVSSYKYEPQFAFAKAATDVVLIGSAHASAGGATEVYVRARVGPLDKTVRVSGDRFWVRSLGLIAMTAPEPFESIPLIYERAFGGWDRSHPDPARHAFEPRNPVGTGFRSSQGHFEEGVRLPNIEDPRRPVREYGDAPAPAGFGFTSPDWQPRAALAGTYDEAWMNGRMPLLPVDFDRRFFSAASLGMVSPGHLRGNEPVRIENASARGTLAFDLPGLAPPRCRVRLAGRRDRAVETSLDTVIVDTDCHSVLLLWRGSLGLGGGPHDVVSIQVEA
jgi:hypothetical protein